MQAELPMLTEYDVQAIKELAAEFEIDFVALTYTCTGDDVTSLRTFLDENDLESTKIIAKACSTAWIFSNRVQCCLSMA